MVERDQVELLAKRQPKNLDELPPALVLRVGRTQKDPDDDSRDWFGWRDQEPSRISAGRGFLVGGVYTRQTCSPDDYSSSP